MICVPTNQGRAYMATTKDKQGSGPHAADRTFKVSELRLDPRNPKRHPEQQIAEIAQSISEFGFIHRIVVRPNGQLIGGEGTLEAIKRLGMDEVECRVVAGLSDAQYTALGLALNRLPERSTWDGELLADLLREVRDADLLQPAGFSHAEADRLIAVPDPIEVREIETGPVADEFWISVRGPLANQADALTAIQDVMRKFPEVSVDLGTISVDV